MLVMMNSDDVKTGARDYTPLLAFLGSSGFFGYCGVFLGGLQSREMATSDTLKVGDRAPDFTLAAANHPGTVSLAELTARGVVVLEFLRGTW
jgi:hypothetical protein